MALGMETRSADALARACELGVAMQLTNIARDVGEDARHGRLYLPRQWLREAGVDPDVWLADPVFNAGVAHVVQRLLREADALYRRAECGVAALPRDCRPAIHAARLVYAEIGRVVEAAGLDSVTRRAVVRRRRKLALIARASSAMLFAPGSAMRIAEPLPAIRYLVDGVATQAQPPRNFYQRTVHILDLLESVELRQRSSARQTVPCP
jgi:phytoene synthase